MTNTRPLIEPFNRPGAFIRCPVAGDVVLSDCYENDNNPVALAGDILSVEQAKRLNNPATLPPVLSGAGLDTTSISALALYNKKFHDELAHVTEMLNETVNDPTTLSEDCILSALPTSKMPLPWIMRLSSLDNTTQGHSLNVALLTGVVARTIAPNNPKVVERAMACALLHDVGKLKIERSILEARRSLTNDEFCSIKTHSQLGYEMLIDHGGIIGRAALSAQRHHVKQPGYGYPEGVSFDELKDIDLIIQFCDIYDALVTARSYKGTTPPFQALHTAYYDDFTRKIETRVASVCVHAIQDGFIGAEVIMPDDSYGTLVDIVDRGPIGVPVIKYRDSRGTVKGDGTQRTEPQRIIGVA